MHILIIEPGKHPREADVPNDLKALQQIVGGYLEAIYPFGDRVALVCDEEAKLKVNSRWNRMVPERGDVIKGTFFLCGLGEDDFADLPVELIAKYKKRFWKIEAFLPTAHGLLPIVLNGQ